MADEIISITIKDNGSAIQRIKSAYQKRYPDSELNIKQLIKKDLINYIKGVVRRSERDDMLRNLDILEGVE